MQHTHQNQGRSQPFPSAGASSRQASHFLPNLSFFFPFFLIFPVFVADFPNFFPPCPPLATALIKISPQYHWHKLKASEVGDHRVVSTIIDWSCAPTPSKVTRQSRTEILTISQGFTSLTWWDVSDIFGKVSAVFPSKVQSFQLAASSWSALLFWVSWHCVLWCQELFHKNVSKLFQDL